MVEPTQSGVEADAVVVAVRAGDKAAFGTLAGTGELLRLHLGQGGELLPRSRRVEAGGRERPHGREPRKKGAR